MIQSIRLQYQGVQFPQYTNCLQKKLDELYNNKKILDHGMVVGKELAYVLSGGDTEKNKEISEDQMYNLELNSFMKLLETQNTQNRIAHTLKTGKPLIN